MKGSPFKRLRIFERTLLQSNISHEHRDQQQQDRDSCTSTNSSCRDMAIDDVTKASMRHHNTFRTANIVGNNERHEIRKVSLDDLSSFYNEAFALKRVSRLPLLRDHAPKVIKADPLSGILVLGYPRLHWAPLLQRVEASAFGLETLLELKLKLCSYIGVLYRNGVVYRVKQDCVYPVKRASGKWTLYLGGWQDVGFYPQSQWKSAALKELKTEQLDRIESFFALLCTRATAIAESGAMNGAKDQGKGWSG
ncbi:uncharacterized protein TRUGW13939_00329 [Talaromyces rugulosus]|uniref:Uncharacterized protein n=1 Tax=Talaromyces rugulosus TaxID=121627 RepID=A0A7H8QJ85_TALRU|nr:uncharacterized protein TRUGW13939_00329 [Talaromyces rugulosus]QKX53253.1 hypothetical protein TRUGW13939_00329 [Talaromyces rugulosus]